MKSLKTIAIAIFVTTIGLGLMGSCKKNEEKSERKVLKEAVSQIGFYETFQLKEIAQNLIDLNNEAAKANADSPTLQQMLNIEDWNAENLAEGVVVGCAAIADTTAIDSIIAQYGSKFLPEKLKLAWVLKPVEQRVYNSQESPTERTIDVLELVALKAGDVNGNPSMNGASIIEATSESDPSMGNVINLRLNKVGAQNFSQFTALNTGRNIAIVLKGKVYSFPKVWAQIDGGAISISGQLNDEDVKNFISFIYGE